MHLPTDSVIGSGKCLPEGNTRTGLRLVPQHTPLIDPQLSISPIVQGAWQAPPNINAGVEEVEWFGKNVDNLGTVAGLWIAVKGKRVRASSDDLEEILDWLTAAHIADALVVQVPNDVTQDRYIIA